VPPYSPVYSAPFIQYTSSTPNLSFEVPAGFTAIVRQISVYQDVGSFVASLAFQDSEAAPNIFVWTGEQSGLVNYIATEGRWVLGEGGIMTMYLSSVLDSLTVYVGGYLLRNTLT
jgi:hypothetical protein